MQMKKSQDSLEDSVNKVILKFFDSFRARVPVRINISAHISQKSLHFLQLIQNAEAYIHRAALP